MNVAALFARTYLSRGAWGARFCFVIKIRLAEGAKCYRAAIISMTVQVSVCFTLDLINYSNHMCVQCNIFIAILNKIFDTLQILLENRALTDI